VSQPGRGRSHSGLRAWEINVDPGTSQRLGRVRQSGTAAEVAVRKLLWNAGYRYTTRNSDLPGRPDLANRARRWAIFVHGCFWHRHTCRRATTPTNNRGFWLEKFDANQQRDRRSIAALQELGYTVHIVWECDLSAPVRLLERLQAVLPTSTTQPVTRLSPLHLAR
jgi:DNA mismatch endonuclease, patch repair protein